MDEMKVHDLMKEDYSGWDVEVLHGIFSSQEVCRILRLPLRRLQGSDRLFWNFTNNSVYSVKTGYLQLASYDASNTANPISNWVWIWKLSVPPKIQVFTWRCMKDILLVCANLIGRFVDAYPFCKKYGTEVETAKHALRDCAWASDYWASSSLRLMVSDPVVERSSISE